MVSTAGGAVALAPLEVPDVLPPGAKAGPWRVERELGRGGMGAVYAVVHEEIGKRAALKVVHRRLLTPGFNVERILLEAKVVNTVGHPNIVDIFETGTLDDGRPYIVMERLEGQPLSYRADESKVLPDQAIAILLQVCDALIAAHAAGVVHRDLKLDNIFLVDNADDPSQPKVKLLDWGIAKVINHNVKHTIDGQLVGTPQYLAPEQARGAEVTPQTDVYSLGVMAYELFLEQLPFEAETSAEIMAMHLRAVPPPPSDIWPDVPTKLEDLLLAMLAKQPEHRPTMLEVAHQLDLVRGELRARQQLAIDQVSIVPASTSVRMATIRPPSVPPVSRESSRERVISSGLAPTEVADWPKQSGRWQYAVGVLALVASAALFLVSRAGDTQTAAAATTSGHRSNAIVETDRGALAVADTVTAPSEVPAAIQPPNLAPAVMASGASKPAPASRASTRSTPSSRQVSTRKAPAMPRRDKRIDPDGTIDPY